MPVPGRGGQGGQGQGAPARRPGVWPSDDNAPRIEVENTPFGFHYAAIRDVTGEPDRKFVRVTAFVAGTDPAVWGPEPDNRRIRLPRQDREAMAAGQSFAGFRGGNRIQDAAVQLSSGPIYDRAKEHLVPADLAIIRLRRLLADSVRLLEAGRDPVGRGEGCDFARITAASQIIDASQAWQDLVPAHQGSAS